MREIAESALVAIVFFFVADFRRYRQDQAVRRASGESLYERRKRK